MLTGQSSWTRLFFMRQALISSGGQISIPAEIRRRWGTDRLLLDDRGDAVVLRPLPIDPIAAAIGSLAGPGPTTDEIRADLREEETEIEQRKWGRT